MSRLSNALSTLMLYIDKVPQHVRLEVLDAAAALEAKAKEPTSQEPLCMMAEGVSGYDHDISICPNPARHPKPSGTKEPEKFPCLHCGHAGLSHYVGRGKCDLCECPARLFSTAPPPKPSGWRARETGELFFGATEPRHGHAIEIHPRAVRVRVHRYSDGWMRECDGSSCKDADVHSGHLGHSEWLQISSEPNVKP